MNLRKTLIVVLTSATAIGAAGLAINFALLPWALHQQELPHIRDTGIGIYNQLFANPGTDDPFTAPWWQRHTLAADFDHGFLSSTEYFIYAVTNDFIEVDFWLFGIPSQTGMLRSTNAAEFSKTYNGWNIVEGTLESKSTNIPFMFTSNLEIDRLDEDLSDKKLTFWKEVVVITKCGSSRIITQKELRSMTNGFGGATNRVLRP